MTDTRIKELMEQIGMPNSLSLYLALKQFQNEVEQAALARNKEPLAWLDPEIDKVITAADKAAAESRHALWHRGYCIPLYS